MKKNIGTIDRIVRIALAAIFALLYFTGTVTGVWGITLVVLGGVFLLTSLVSFCPIYAIIGTGTRPADKAK